MDASNGQAYFTEFTSEEADSKIRHVASAKSSLKVWLKGTKTYLKLTAEEAKGRDLTCFIDDSKPSTSFENKDILFNIDYHGLQVFGAGRLVRSGISLVLRVGEKVFKCERRKNFRLLAYPTHTVNGYFQLPKDLKEGGKVLEFKTKRVGEQTKLFKKFLKLMNSDSFDGMDEDEAIVMRVLDLSVSGVALKISEYEKAFFDNRKKLDPFILHFNNQYYNIPGGEVVYVIDYIDFNQKGLKLFKVGVRFHELEDSLYKKLTRHLTKEFGGLAKEDEEEFEDFIS